MSQWSDGLGLLIGQPMSEAKAEDVLERARKELVRRGMERTRPARVINVVPAGDDLDHGVLPVMAGAPAGGWPSGAVEP